MAHVELTGRGDDDGDSESARVLSRSVDWAALQDARLLGDREVQLLRRYDKRDPVTQAGYLQQDGLAYAQAWLAVLYSISKDETLEYTLAMMEAAAAANDAWLQHYHIAQRPDQPPAAYSILLRLLARPSWYIQDRASRLLLRLLSQRPDKGRALNIPAASGSSAPALPQTPVAAIFLGLLEWANTALRAAAGDARAGATAAHALAGLLAEREMRPLVHRLGLMALLPPLLRNRSSPQTVYETACACWLLTYYAPAAEATVSTGVLAALIDAAKTSTSEKVVRVALLAMRNLLRPESAARPTAEAAAGRLASALRLRHFKDEEIEEMIGTLEERAGGAAAASDAAGWETYKQELLAGVLDWGGARAAEKFWRENAGRFEEGNCQLVRVLVKLLESADPKTLAVACSDLGQFAAAHARGRAIVAECGGKERVVALMGHADADVAKAALLCVQKLLVSNWQSLASLGGGEA